MKNKKKIVFLITIISSLFLSLWISGLAFRKNTITFFNGKNSSQKSFSRELKDENKVNFTNVVIRKGSEYGEVVANVLNNENLVLDPNTDYYLCVNANTPTGNDGYFKVSIAKEKANGFNYINIPGQTYIPQNINSDSFSKLLEYKDTEDLAYGSGTNVYSLIDGMLKYEIKHEKMGGQEIYSVFGFKMDEIVWNESNISIEDSISIEMGNSEGSTDIITISSTINAKKSFYISAGGGNINVNQDIQANPIGFGLASSTLSPLMYQEIGYKVTYPNVATYDAASNSSTNSSSVASTTYGNYLVGPEVDNGDGTYSKTITIGSGKKEQTGISGFVYNYLTFTSDARVGQTYEVVFSDAYYIPKNSTDKIDIQIGNNTSTSIIYKAKVFSSIDPIDRTEITAVNRNGNISVYNWNMTRQISNLNDAVQMLGAANIKNTDSLQSNYAKTVRANYNITNENVIVSFVYIPVGVNKNGTALDSIKVKYTAYDQNDNLISNTITIPKNKTYGSDISKYTYLNAHELGVKSIKSIEADIGYLPAGFYSSGWTASNSAGGNSFSAFGYYTDNQVGNRVKNTFEVVNTDTSAPTNDLKVTSNVDNVNYAKVNMNNSFQSNESKTSLSVVAGNSLTLKNKTINPQYAIYSGYTNQTVLVNPVLYIFMPEGMSFENLQINKYTTNSFNTSRNNKTESLDLNINNITYLNKKDDGTNIYKVTFKDNNLVIGNLCNSYMDSVQLKATLTINTMKTMTTKVYDLDDLFQVGSEDENVIMNDYGSSKGQTLKKEDVYIVNNGVDLAGSRTWNASITGISVQRLEAITVENAISVQKIDGAIIDESRRTWNIYDENNQNSIAYLGLNTEGQYRITIKNPSASSADNFQLILPIPKIGENLGTAFANEAFDFNLSLNPISVGEYDIKYIKIGENIDATSLVKDIIYKETDKGNANAILITREEIPAFESCTLYFEFTVGEKDNNIVGGEFNSWRNYFSYKLDNNTVNTYGSYVATEVAVCNLHGIVFEDTNNNNLKDSNENGLSGVNITAVDGFGRVQFAESDNNGYYNFTNVREDNINLTMEINPNNNYWFNGEKKANTQTESYNNVEKDEINNKKATANVYASGDEVSVNASVNKVYKITYDANGASGSAPATKEYLYGTNAIISTPPSGMLLNGSEFIGWSTTKLSVSDDNEEKVEYKAGDTIVVKDDMTLYAVYKTKYIKITFDYQGADEKIYDSNQKKYIDAYDSKFVRAGYRIDVADKDGRGFPTIVMKEGYKFWKWEVADGEIGRGTSISSSTTVTFESDTIIRAVFLKLNKNEDNVNITYGDVSNNYFYSLYNELSVINLPKYYNYGTDYSLANESELPKGLKLQNGDIVGTAEEIFDGDVKFIAHTQIGSNESSYKEFEFTLNIKVNPKNINMNLSCNHDGGIVISATDNKVKLTANIEGLVDSTKVNENNEVTFYAKKGEENIVIGKSNVLDGKATIEWDVDSTLVGTYSFYVSIDNLSGEYNLVNNIGISSFVVSLTELKKYVVSFNSNGYNINVNEVYYVENTEFGNLPNIKIDGYTFLGWYDGNDNKIEASDQVVDNIELFAKYNPLKYKVKYTSEVTVINIPDKNNVLFNDNNLLPNSGYEVPGYVFKGFTTKNGKLVNNSMKYGDLVGSDTETDVTLYANYEEKEYIVTYDAKGGTTGVNSFKVIYNHIFGELVTPVLNGYIFEGWYYNNQKISGSDIYKYTQDITLTAKWKEKSGYKVKFETNGGNLIEPKDVSWNTTIESLNVIPEKKGYTFKNWIFNGEATSSVKTYGQLAASDKYESITLLAEYERNMFTVSFKSNEFTLNINDIDYGEFDVLGIFPSPTIEGYTFEGWYYSDGTKATEQDVIIENTILYAKWNKIHVHSIVLKPAKLPNCTETGNDIYYVCSECNKAFEDAVGAVEINPEDKTIAIVAEAHEWNNYVESEPATVNSTGVKIRICKYNSSHAETVAIDKLTNIAKDEKSSSPNTGDNIIMYVALMVISGLGIIGAIKYLKKMNKS